MSFTQIILLYIIAMMTLPISVYISVKFGMAGYYRAKERHQKKKRIKHYGT